MIKPDSISHNDWELLTNKYNNLNKIIKKINNDYPIQYLIGNVEFYGLKMKVNKNVLIPRFETEYLVEKTIAYINKLKLNKASLLDIGTGSGCISIVLKKEICDLEITGLDISRKALKVARFNAKKNKVKVNFIKKDIFKFKPVNIYNVIVSNPPYIKDGDIIDSKTKYEPSIAIYGGKDGLKYYEHIFKLAKTVLDTKYLIALEIDEDAGVKLKKLAKKYFSNAKINLEKDLTNKNRYLFIYSE